jgi:hypothetical protein
MKFKLYVEMDNAAFGEDSGDRGVELARVLRTAAERIERCGVSQGDEGNLRDVNGNRVGGWRVQKTDNPISTRGMGPTH